jgi:thiol-disulfide isomerase/thioredoxin
VMQINEELNSIEPDRPDFSVLHQQVKTLTPDAFKATTQTSWNNARKKLDAQLSGNKYLEHTQVILRNQIDLDYAFVFLEFIRLRESIQKRDTTNKIVVVRESKSFYDFLSKNNFDGRGLLISSNFSSFMERLESSKPYWEPHSRSHFDVERNKSDTTISPQVVRLLQNWQMADTLLPNKYALTPGFLYELSKARSLKFIFESTLKDRKDDGRIYLTQLANGMSHPFLLKESEELFHRKYSNTGRTYTLPDNMSAAFFKSIINRHKGKMLFVDFWATFCAPCISNIRTQLPLRDKYKNNPDFDFIFITSEDDSPLKTYEKFIGEQALKNTYRISEKDFLSIRQLFKFNGIPRYVIIDKEGKVLNDDFRMHNFQYELPKLFPEKEWK